MATILENLLLAGALFISLPCYSLTSDCPNSPLSVFDREYTGTEHPVFWVDSGSKTANSLNTEEIFGSRDKPPETAVPNAISTDRELVSRDDSFFVPDCAPGSDGNDNQPATPANNPAKTSENSTVERVPVSSRPADRNREIYYRNKTELAFDLGTLPINIPFPFDFIEGDPYTQHPIRYTLVPIIVSLRWQMSDIGGLWIFRGNWDLTSSGSFTWIPSGPETRFISYDMGIRRNFVPHNRNFAPYFDIRLGVGQINAKGPKGVPYAQGEDWPEFTMNMGTGVRYNFSPRFAFSAGLNYMHLSNMDLSEHKPNATDPNWGPINYGINVYGPELGINMRLGKFHRE